MTNANTMEHELPDKIAGIHLLKKLPFISPTTKVIDILATERASKFLTMSNNELRKLLKLGENIMARPCPMKPRHGFVQSREVANVQDLLDIARETMEVEADAWLMLNESIYAKHSAVITPGVVAIGERNDGVTSGSRSVTLPMRTSFPEQLASKCIEVVMEGLSRGCNTYLVQAKSMENPYMPVLRDYIPERIKVLEVVHANKFTDLEWEKYVRKLADEARIGSIVAYMPGASLLSHKALWCIAYGMPVVTTHEPEVWQELAPTHPRVIQLGPSKYRLALHYGLQQVFADSFMLQKIVWAAAHAIHHYSTLSLYEDSKLFVVAALAAFAKLMFAACVAEARYVSSLRYGKHRQALVDLGGLYALIRNKSGDEIRQTICDRFVVNKHSVALVRRLRDLFSKIKWDSGDYGGAKWAELAENTAGLLEHLLDMDLNSAIGAANTLLHLEHNSSLAIDKYVGLSKVAIQNRLSAIGGGDFIMLMEALPGIAQLCDFLLNKRDMPIPEGSVLDSYGCALMPSYYADTRSPVVSCQEAIVRHGADGAAFMKHLREIFDVHAKGEHVTLIEGSVERVFVDWKGNQLDKLCMQRDSNLAYSDPPDDTYWELVRFVPENPAVYHDEDMLGIVVDDALCYISTKRQNERIAYHVGEGHYGVPLVVACPAPGERAYKLILPTAKLMAMQELGFGLNFTIAEAPTAYSLALHVVGHKLSCRIYPEWLHLDRLLLGMALRYLAGLALVNYNRYHGRMPLNDIWDVSAYPFGVALVDGATLFEEVRSHASILRESLESGAVVGLDMFAINNVLQNALTVIQFGNFYDVEESCGLDMIRLQYDGLLRKRFVWDLFHGVVTELQIPSETESMHYLDMVHGLAMVKRAIDRQLPGTSNI